jgi:hypothetical protein
MRAAASPLAPERSVLLRRARVAAEVARCAVQSSEPFDGSIDPVLCELYRQSIRWSLRCFAADVSTSHRAAPSEHGRTDAWSLIDQTLLLKASGGGEMLARVRYVVDDFSAEAFAELAPAECALLANTLRTLAAALMAELDISRRLVDAIWLQRALRVAFVAALFLACGAGIVYAKDAAERRRDVAVGKAWRASSKYSVGGCQSPAQQCDDSPDYFFHTQEEANPWIEFDLGSVQRVRAVRLENRKDCCVERATPLVVETSTDDHTWKTVARHEGAFTGWLAEFAPIDARWVRLRVERRVPFHLLAVRVLR